MFLFKFAWKFISFLLLVALVIPLWAIGKTWYTAQNETIRKADAIVVMGAAQLDGRPGEVLEARLKESIRIYEKGFATKIYTLGAGAPGDRFTEAAASRSYLISKGVRAKSITAVAKGRDTFRSIQALSKADGVKSIIDNYCHRSLSLLKIYDDGK